MTETITIKAPVTGIFRSKVVAGIVVSQGDVIALQINAKVNRLETRYVYILSIGRDEEMRRKGVNGVAIKWLLLRHHSHTLRPLLSLPLSPSIPRSSFSLLSLIK